MKPCFRWVSVLRSRLAAAIAALAQQCEARRYLRSSARFYRWALAIAPLRPSSTLATIIACAYAEVLVQLELWDAAINVYTQVTQKDPNHAVAWFRLSGLLVHVHGYEAAINSYLEAVRCDPTRQWFYHPLLWDVLATTGQLPRLEADFVTLLERQGEVMRYRDRADIRLNLAEVLTRQGKIDTAAVAYRQAMYDRLVQNDRRFRDELWNPEGDRDPNFIIIGAEKCGTTSLFYYLVQHPNVLSSLRKEINFWSNCADYGLEWYRSQLAPHPAKGHWLSGESSPSYFISSSAPERLAKALPQVKLIVLLRDPADRVVSYFHHRQRQNKEFRSLATAVDDLLLTFNRDPELPELKALTAGFYAQHLRRWFQHIDRDRLLILQAETFFEQPDRIMAEVHQFLGLPHVTLDDYRAYNAGSYPAAEAEVRAKLADFFAPYNQDLETLLDRKFHW